VPLAFLKRLGSDSTRADTTPVLLPEEVEAQEYELKLTYRAKASQGVRMTAGPSAMAAMPEMLAGIATREVQIVPPLGMDVQDAAPLIVRPEPATAWLNANRGYSPITRHALMVLESLDAIDPAFETAALSILSGELDTAGYPEFDAVVGGVVSHWDEASGDLIMRAIVGWGGKGVRGDTDRIGNRTLASILANVLANVDAVGFTEVERPMVPIAGSGGLVCAHCGFATAHERAFYCPKCGMRMLRG
jgi:hypothetical protein